jgi:hypothetical protein
VWGRARRYLESVSQAVSGSNILASGLILEYIDGFIWDGAREECRAEELLRNDSERVTQSIFSKGPDWHLYQGWFLSPDAAAAAGGLPASDLPEGRILERMHIDSGETHFVLGPTGAAEPILAAKMDNLLRYDFKMPLSLPEITQGGGVGERVFQILHGLNKKMMSSVLRPDLADRINLNA